MWPSPSQAKQFLRLAKTGITGHTANGGGQRQSIVESDTIHQATDSEYATIINHFRYHIDFTPNTL